MNVNFKFCYKCGQKLNIDANFCVKCGVLQPKINRDEVINESQTINKEPQTEKVINNTVNENVNITPTVKVEEEQIDIDNKSQVIPEKVEETTYSVIKKEIMINNEIRVLKQKNNTFDIISRSLLFILSWLLFIFSLYPTMSLEVDNVEVAHFNSYDAINFMFDSFKSLDENELKNSRFYTDYLNALTNYNNINGLDLEQLEINDAFEVYNDYIHLDLKYKLQSENSGFRIDVVMCGITSLLYVIFVLIFLILSLLSLLSIYIDGLKNLKKPIIILVTFIPLLQIILYFLHAAYMGNTYPAKLGDGAISAIVFSGAFIVYEIIKNVKIEDFSFDGKTVKINIGKLVLCILAMIFVFAPFTVSKIEYNKGDDSYSAEIKNEVFTFNNYFDVSNYQYQDWEQLSLDETTAYFNELFNDFKKVSIHRVENGSLNKTNILFLVFAGATIGQYESTFPLFFSISLITFIGLIILAFMTQQILLYFLTGKSFKILNKIAGISQALLFIIALCFTIVYLNIINTYSLGRYCLAGYELKIASGLIFLVIFSILLAGYNFIPQKKQEEALPLLEKDN